MRYKHYPHARTSIQSYVKDRLLCLVEPDLFITLELTIAKLMNLIAPRESFCCDGWRANWVTSLSLP